MSYMSTHGKIGPSAGDRRPKLMEVDMTPEELGDFLSGSTDVIIIGGAHSSQLVSNAQRDVSQHFNANILFVEGASSISEGLKSKLSKNEAIVNDWGVSDDTMSTAYRQGAEIVGADLEVSQSENFSRIALDIVDRKKGELARFSLAGDLAVQFLEDKGVDLSTYKQDKSHNTHVDSAKKFIAHFDKDLHDFHKDNLMDAAKDADRFNSIQQGSVLAKAGKAIDFVPDLIKHQIELGRRLGESNPVFAANIDSELKELRKVVPDARAALPVGMKHNKGIEDILEKKGYGLLT